MAIRTIKTDVELLGSGTSSVANVKAINDNFVELFTKGVAVVNATNTTDVITSLNALLASLRTANVINT